MLLADCRLRPSSDFHFKDIVPAGGAAWGEVVLAGLPAFGVFGGEMHCTMAIAMVDGIHSLHEGGIALVRHRLFFREE